MADSGRPTSDSDRERAEALARRCLARWTLPLSAHLSPIPTGSNNVSLRVECGRAAYVLRLHRGIGGLARVRAEQELLDQLVRHDLSFDVPRPLPAADGSRLAVLDGAVDGSSDASGYAVAAPATAWIATLVDWIPGQPATRGSASQADACGAALGELGRALSRCTTDRADADGWFRLAGVHPAVGDPVGALADLPTGGSRGTETADVEGAAAPLTESERDRVVEVAARYERTIPALLRSLPRRLLHGDFYPSNVVVLDGRVSGVLDFEFVAPGPGVCDLAIALAAFALTEVRDPGGTGRHVPVWSLDRVVAAALCAGYRRWLPVSPGEVEALPPLIVWRELVSVVHRVGRVRSGAEAPVRADLPGRVRRLLSLEAWTGDHGDAIRRCAG